MPHRTIRIGNGAGFWGDNLDAPRLLAEKGRLDYLTLEYLAELTMSILAYLRSREPAAGYVTDFPTVVRSLVNCLKEQPKLRIVTNAGGTNPAACARAISSILSQNQLEDCPIGVVTGDDLLGPLDDYCAAGEEFRNLETGKELGNRRASLTSAHAYLVAAGTVEALQKGARLVITGRIADASLTLGPAIYEFGWKWDDLDKLAQATVAGHLIECGAQVTGGMCTGLNRRANLRYIGYPIAEISPEAEVWITKPEQTGGIVDRITVSEQLIYEIGNSACYMTPDLCVDFREIQLHETAADVVQVTGAKGAPAPERLKVSMTLADGFQASGTLVIVGPDAELKARQSAEILIERVRTAGYELEQTHVECLGMGETYPGSNPPWKCHPWEVVLRVSAHDHRREAIERFVREFAPLVASGPAGVTGYVGSRVKPQPRMRYWPTTIERSRVRHQVEVKTAGDWLT